MIRPHAILRDHGTAFTNRIRRGTLSSHVVGNDRKAIFKNDGDRKLFLDTLAQVIKRFHWICHAYCLMDNHYHLIVETPEPWLDFDQQHVATVSAAEGVYQLLDKNKRVLRIAGAPNLREALEEQLKSDKQARSLYTKRQRCIPSAKVKCCSIFCRSTDGCRRATI